MNIILEVSFDRAESDAINELLHVFNAGGVDLAITSTVHCDIWFGELAQKLSELPELGIDEVGTVTRLGHWVLGR